MGASHLPSERGWSFVYFLSSPTFSRVRLSCPQKRSTAGINILSEGEWTSRKVGPNDTMSRCGYFVRNRPHSNPACIAFMAGVTP